MNNQWRDNANCMVVWADGTYDRSRTCNECCSSACKNPVHEDRYKEVGQTRLEKEDSLNGQDYWAWMRVNQPLKGYRDSDGEVVVNELVCANPDWLHEGLERNSGIDEAQHGLSQAAYESLTGKQKEVWQLVMRDQVSQTEAGRRLGISQQAIEKHLRYAKVAFTNYLRDHNVGA